jgi:geranylgeranyl reductase family protein
VAISRDLGTDPSTTRENPDDHPFDVVVIGAGPAGSSAALAAAKAGARTLILDRAGFPRYKTCGGGLIGLTLGSLPADLDVPVRQEVFSASFSHLGRAVRARRSAVRLLSLVDRADFDQALLDRAIKAGAFAQLGTTVTGLVPEPDGVRLETSAGVIRARYVIGADGSASRVARQVGVELDQVDLGLEVELDAGAAASRWAGRIHLDWGPVPGSYAWVFPKGEILTVGVISRKGTPEQTRAYLASFVAQQGLEDAETVRESGHLTRCRSRASPLGRGRILVCGDAAGLLEPWTREGISFAVRSGALAGRVAGATAAGAVVAGGEVDGTGRRTAESLVPEYTAAIEADLVPEMAAGRLLLAAFERHPAIMHTLLARTPVGWWLFGRITRGETTYARILRHRPVRSLIRALGRR